METTDINFRSLTRSGCFLIGGLIGGARASEATQTSVVRIDVVEDNAAIVADGGARYIPCEAAHNRGSGAGGLGMNDPGAAPAATAPPLQRCPKPN